MSNYGLADRLNRWVSLTPAERDALSRLEDRPKAIRRGAVLMEEQGRSDELGARCSKAMAVAGSSPTVGAAANTSGSILAVSDIESVRNQRAV